MDENSFDNELHVKVKNGVIQKVRSLRGGGGGHWKANKNEQGEGGPSICVRLLFLKKMLRFSKWSLIVILQFFLLIITAVWNIKPSWKIIIFSPVNEGRAIAFASHKADTLVMHQWCPLYRDSTVAF